MRAIGPLWLGAVCDRSVLTRMQEELPPRALGTKTELHRLLSLCAGELDSSFHYDYHQLAKSRGISPPPLDTVLDSLIGEGFHASRAHYSGTALKTDAPAEALLRAIVQK